VGGGGGDPPGVWTYILSPPFNSLATGSVSVTVGSLQPSRWTANPGDKERALVGGFKSGEAVTVYYETGLPKDPQRVVCKAKTPKGGQVSCLGYLPTKKFAGATGAHVLMAKAAKSGHIAEVAVIIN
jgi:hypothetical protein